MRRDEQLIQAGEALACSRYTRIGGGHLQDTDGPRRVAHERVLAAAEAMLARGSASFMAQRAEAALVQLWCFITFFAYGLQEIVTLDDEFDDEASTRKPTSAEDEMGRARPVAAGAARLHCCMREVWTRVALLKRIVRQTEVTRLAATRWGSNEEGDGRLDGSADFDGEMAMARVLVHLQLLWEVEVRAWPLPGENPVRGSSRHLR